MSVGKILVAGFLLFSLGGSTATSWPPEPVPPGCQILGAKPANPIRLRGKILATYLPDGKRYTKLKPPAKPDPFELGLLDLDRPGSAIQRLSHDGLHDAEVALSPDGKKFVWTVRPALDVADQGNSIMIANLDMSEKRVLAKTENYMGIPSFAAPSSDKVIYSFQGDGDEDDTVLLFADLKTGKTTQLRSTFKGGIHDPQISPDGKQIAFKSYDQPDNEDPQIYIMEADGTRPRRLTRNKFQDEDPAFSPDGKTIAFERAYGASKHKGQHRNDSFYPLVIVSLDLATGKETVLTEPDVCGKNENWLPTWSPDGELIMFTRGLHMENGEFTHDLWVMRKDGSDLQRVPGSEGIMFFDWLY